MPPVTIDELEPDEILEHLARRLGIDRGEWMVTAVFSNGSLRRSHLERGPMRKQELRDLAGELQALAAAAATR